MKTHRAGLLGIVLVLLTVVPVEAATASRAPRVSRDSATLTAFGSKANKAQHRADNSSAIVQ